MITSRNCGSALSLRLLLCSVSSLLFLVGIASAQGPSTGPNPVTDIYGHMGIGTIRPDISAVLDLSRTDAGVLIPRMTTLQRDGIFQPAHTLVIYHTSLEQFEYNEGTPLVPNWVPFLTGRVSFAQIGGGTNSGQNLNVGNGSILKPTGTGVIIANNISGAGVGNFAGSITIPDGAVTMNIAYTGLASGATVLVTVTDPTAPGFVTTTTSKSPGIGFAVQFSSSYSNPFGDAKLDYVVINP